LPESIFYGADLAYIHHVGFGGFAAAAAPALGDLLRAAGIRDGLVVDVGCGTGILARALTERGYDVLGIDVSAHMIERARGVAPRARFMNASIRNTSLPPCRAVLAIGESLSYVTGRSRRQPDLRPLFARIGRALLPGGLFVFDLVVAGRPLMSYRTWHLGTDWAVLADVSERSPTGVVTRRITTFRGRAGGYRRTDECHAVGVYDREVVLRLLKAAGLSASVRRRYGRADLPPRRLVFVARRPHRAGQQIGSELREG
jgi:SAM-dependent methyltransferase